ncbi:hypothetical protein DXG03_009175 [Asterophora parasitica]|uniref:F-box domain-containing protein n=1 Tax=Asterophora parasitica TaxID=117018 RepID=A0A9P7G063_9AGAR|nr:hypothetical protein DXG03_009175 [Asterophora parasitica]
MVMSVLTISSTREQMLESLTYRRTYNGETIAPMDTDAVAERISEKRSPTSSIGELQILPLELLYLLFELSDLQAPVHLRLTCRRARMLVDASPSYRCLRIHTPHVICILLRVGIASHFTVSYIAELLHSDSRCSRCGRFGSFLYIPECVRCCYSCMRFHRSTVPMTKADSMAAFGLTARTIATLPVMTTVPGTYGGGLRAERSRPIQLLSPALARAAAELQHGGKEYLVAYIEGKGTQAKRKYDKRVTSRLALLALNPPEYDQDGNLAGPDWDDVKRYMAAMPFPYLDPSLGDIHDGMSCKGCRHALDNCSSSSRAEIYHRVYRAYTVDGFFEHYVVCKEAQHLWKSLGDL